MKKLHKMFWPVGAIGALLSCIAALWAVYSYRAGHRHADVIEQSDATDSGVAESAGDPTAESGKYLVDAGNCISCHTRAGAAAFSGGVPFETPFGRIYSTNITPDLATGIGKWSFSDLVRAMHEGVAVGGHRLFPAFPYPSFTRIIDQDVRAIYAYLRTLKPIRYAPPSNDFLLTQRWSLISWNALFFKERRFISDAARSAEWNRGAYLVEGLGHCDACHTPRNFFMAEIAGRAYEGGLIDDTVSPGKTRQWSAVNLSSARNGLAAWSVEDLAKYLQTGFSPRAGTFGPMNSVIVNSLSKLRREDVRAMAVYLKSIPAQEYRGESVSQDQTKEGERIYKDHCEKCHSPSGRGGMFSAPPLVGSPVVLANSPASLINIILYGPEIPKGVSSGSWETMKPFNDLLDDSQVSAVSNYVRGSWGHRASPVSAGQVAQQR
jgi:mono/diheme cytochrome c family protein